MDETVYIIGGGNSVTEETYRLLNNRSSGDIICTNFTYRLVAPTILTWIDAEVYTNNKQEIDALSCKKFSRENIHYEDKGIHQVKLASDYVRTQNLDTPLYAGKRNRGYFTGAFAISVAFALGYKQIYLLGYDGGAINGKLHHHSYSLRENDAFSKTTDTFEPFRGLNITNLSQQSKIEVFKKDDLSNVINKIS